MDYKTEKNSHRSALYNGLSGWPSFQSFNFTRTQYIPPDPNVSAVEQKVTLITPIVWQNMEIRCVMSTCLKTFAKSI